MSAKPEEPSIKLPSRITPGQLGFCALLLFFADRGIKMARDWADDRALWAQRIQRWDGAERMAEANKLALDAQKQTLAEIRESLKTQWQAMQDAKGAKP